MNRVWGVECRPSTTLILTKCGHQPNNLIVHTHHTLFLFAKICHNCIRRFIHDKMCDAPQFNQINFVIHIFIGLPEGSTIYWTHISQQISI